MKNIDEIKQIVNEMVIPELKKILFGEDDGDVRDLDIKPSFQTYTDRKGKRYCIKVSFPYEEVGNVKSTK